MEWYHSRSQWECVTTTAFQRLLLILSPFNPTLYLCGALASSRLMPYYGPIKTKGTG